MRSATAFCRPQRQARNERRGRLRGPCAWTSGLAAGAAGPGAVRASGEYRNATNTDSASKGIKRQNFEPVPDLHNLYIRIQMSLSGVVNGAVASATAALGVQPPGGERPKQTAKA